LYVKNYHNIQPNFRDMPLPLQQEAQLLLE